MRVFDLFSGAGGMAEGFLQAGFEIPYATDISEQAATTYRNRHKQLGYEVKFYNGDIRELAKEEQLRQFLGADYQNIDVICGGPPCQGFSMAGQRDAKDLRNFLVQNYIEILSQVQPKYFVMENVVGLLSSTFEKYQGKEKMYKKQAVLEVLKSEFDYIGYKVKVEVLNASDYGVPQSRKRIFILGTRKDIEIEPKFPQKLKYKVSVKDAISDLENKKTGDLLESLSPYQNRMRKGRTPFAGRRKSAKYIMNHEKSIHSELVVERFSKILEGESFKDTFERLSEKDKEKYKTKKMNCKRIRGDRPSPTVVTLPDDYVHYNLDRIMTVREMARLQSFDDNFEFLGKRTTGGDLRKKETPQYTLVGNAVPPLLAYAVAKEIMKVLEVENERTSVF